jgi:ABC-2 type transport system permease protein
MKQIYTLIADDLRSQLRERGTIVLMLAGLLLAVFGLYEGVRFDRHGRDAVAAAAAQQAQAKAGAKDLAQRYFADPTAAEFAGLQWYKTPVDVRGYAFREHVGFAGKPAVPGAALAIGQADLLPAYVRVRAESMESVRTALDIEHPALLAAGRFDLMFFVVYLWPLILLALTTSVLTQDRESLRLRALQLQGVRLGRMLAAQIGARALVATAVLLAVCVAGALALGAVGLDGAGVAALLKWGGVVLLYSLFWAAVAVAICAVCGNRMSAAFAGFGAWLALAILVPGAITALVQIGAPVPQRERYVQAMRDAGDQVAANKLDSLARFYDSHPDWRPAGSLDKVTSSVTRLQRAQELERVMADVDRRFEQARQRQQRWFDRALAFSPVTLTYQMLATIAGNDGERHQRFLAEVQQHQQGLRDYFQRTIQLSALGDQRRPCPATCLGGYGFRDFDQVPVFAPSPGLAGLSAWRSRLLPLPVWTAIMLTLAALLLARTTPRRRAA